MGKSEGYKVTIETLKEMSKDDDVDREDFQTALLMGIFERLDKLVSQ